MALCILTKEARKRFEIEGSAILYTPCGWGEYQEIGEKCRDPKTLIVDEVAVDRTILEKHVVTWENVVDQNGEAVPFDFDALWHLSPMLIRGLLARITSPVVEEEKEQGNSDSSSDT